MRPWSLPGSDHYGPADHIQVVVVGMSADELRSIEASLAERGDVRLLAFDSIRQLAANLPRQSADLVLLRTGRDKPLQQGLKWIRRHWPQSLCAVCSTTAQAEITARSHGAMFFVDPTEDDLHAIVDGALQSRCARRHTA